MKKITTRNLVKKIITNDLNVRVSSLVDSVKTMGKYKDHLNESGSSCSLQLQGDSRLLCDITGACSGAVEAR